MHCRTCGSEINDNAEICIKCGCRPLIGKSYCQNCGASTTEQQEICTKCGVKLKSIVSKSTQMGNGKEIFGKILMILGIILLVITVLRVSIGFISKEFIYDLIYYPQYFFQEDMGIALICLFTSIIFLIVGKHLNKSHDKFKSSLKSQLHSNINNNILNEAETIIDYQSNSRFKIQSDNVAENLRDISKMETEKANRGIVTPPVQAQSKQTSVIKTASPEQTQSILDEQKLLNYLKDMPVKWEFGNPNALENKELQGLCSIFLNDKSVLSYLCPDYIRQMEFIIQKKRARTPKKADYGKVMDKNILYELYKYSYLMNTFNVLENRENDIIKIDRVEFWNIIQEDCNKRLENLEYEKRNNPAIHNMFQKYELDTSKVKMVVNDYVEPREYDYIYASLMTTVLLTIVLDFVLSGETKMGNSYKPTLQIIHQYSASDIIAVLDASISANVNFSLGLYANGGRLPTSIH